MISTEPMYGHIWTEARAVFETFSNIKQAVHCWHRQCLDMYVCVCCQCVITATVQPSDSYIDSYIVRFPLLYRPLLLGLSRHGYAGITFESGHR